MSVSSSWRTDVSLQRNEFSHAPAVSRGADGFYFQMHHAKIQEKELLVEMSFFLITIFIVRVILLCKVWTNFSFGLPSLADRFFCYIALLVKIHICDKVFYSMCHSKNPSALSRTGIFWPFRWECWKKKEDFAAYLKVNHSLHHFVFLQDLVPHRQRWTENICLWLIVLMQRFVSAASSCLGGAGRRWNCCSGCYVPWTCCFSAQLLVRVLLCTFNATALVTPRACYLQPCSLPFTHSPAPSQRSCCGSIFQSF